ncbi:unnamed protein product [Diamesa serratosioi]
MFKILGILVLCVQLIIGAIETEELKRQCLSDEEFTEDVKICSVKDGIAIFEVKDRSTTFRCITITFENESTDDYPYYLTMKLTNEYVLSYLGAVARTNKTDEINLKLFNSHTARLAIISYKYGFAISEVSLNGTTLTQDWNCKDPKSLKDSCGKQTSNSQIDKTKNLSWPWVAAIYQSSAAGKNDRYKCIGTIISTKYILTSQNCLFYEGRLLKSTELKVHVSKTDLNPYENSQAFKIYKVTKVSQHEQYKFALENNIALLKVENYIEFNDFVGPICLPKYDREIGENGNAVGFGLNEWNYFPESNQRTENVYSLITRDDCQKNEFLQHFKHIQTFCGFSKNILDASGSTVRIEDLGSGLYIKKNDKYFIGGIISKASTTNDRYVVFTDVYQYLNWINSHTKAFVSNQQLDD